MSDFYSVPPASREQFVADLWEFGLATMVVEPSPSWLVDYDSETVKEIESGFAPLHIDNVTVEEVRASSGPGEYGRELRLNRLTGNGTLTVYAQVTDWNARFGSRLLGHRTWNLECQAAKRVL